MAMDKRVVERLYKAFSTKKYRVLRKLYSDLVNQLVTDFSDETLEFAILAYALGKILLKQHYVHDEYEKYREDIVNTLKGLAEGTFTFKESIAALRQILKGIESLDPRYVFDVVTKAKIKIAATLYAKGISLGRVAEMTGIPKAEILSYAGKTMMFDRVKEEMPVKKRFKYAEEVFGLEH